MDPSKKLKVTIITVVKNGEKVIQRLFNSIREFKKPGVEFIVWDGLSTDNTVNIIRKNEGIIDKWLSVADLGIYDAMNKSVKLANGEWIIFIGADDELLQGFEQVIPLLKNENHIYYGNVFFHNSVVTGKINDYLMTKTNICHQAIFYHRNVFDTYCYETEYVKCADYVLNLNLWHNPGFKFVYVNYMIANFSKGGFSTYKEDFLFNTNRERLFREYLKPMSYYRFLNKTLGTYKTVKQILLNR